MFASSWLKGISVLSMLASWMPRWCIAFGPRMVGMKTLAKAILAPATLKAKFVGTLRTRTRVRSRSGASFAGISTLASVGS